MRETRARALDQEAARHCPFGQGPRPRDRFEKLMADEEHPIDVLETQLDLVAKLALERYAQHHIGEISEGGKD